MRLEPSLSQALEGALCRGAFFAETHAIKGLLALERMRHMEGFEVARLTEMTRWNQLLRTPVIGGLLSEQVSWPSEELDERRLRALIEGAVFPMAYLAGVEWVRRSGYEHLVESFRELALARIGYLGHSWTIWCSFLEIAPYLEDERQRWLAAERFVEFAASQLSTPDWTPAYDIAFGLESGAPPEADVVTAVLSRPGFYGHRLIALSYLYKYRETLTAAQWDHGLKRTLDSTRETGSPAHDIHVPAPAAAPDLDDRTRDEAVLRYLQEGAEEVHTLTLADAARELWCHLGDDHRGHLLESLRVYGAWKIARTASGERKKA